MKRYAKNFLLFLFTGFTLFSSVNAYAFPEMVRHGYPNCMTCHVSPSGGGVLTEYGRALSKELLSTWSYENEERFMYAVPASERAALGGDIRWIQVKERPPAGEERKREIWMQRDLEAALLLGKWSVAATAGVEKVSQDGSDRFISRRHYAVYQATDEMIFRAGRFYPQVGIYVPDHNATIRRGSGFDQAMETYNAEGSYQSEKWNFFATAILGRPDDKTIKREAGGALSAAYNVTDTHKVGFSHYYGETDEITRHVMGPYAILGFSKQLFLLTQLNAIRSFPYQNTDPTWGVLNYTKLGYEPYRGIVGFITQEFSQSNLESNLTRADILGAGLQLFPRPHWEFQATLQKVYSQGFSGTPTDRFLFVAHFYP